MQYVVSYEYSPEVRRKILADAGTELDRRLVEQILDLFVGNGLTVKAKHCFPETPNAYWRVLCFIKKSAEAVIANMRTDLGKDGVIDGLNIQVRIAVQATLDDLASLTDNVRAQILSANDCRFCSEKCEGKRYVFSCDGAQYTKCQYLNSNFRFKVQNEADALSMLAIIGAEIDAAKKKPGRRR